MIPAPESAVRPHALTFWRTLDELADEAAFQELLHREFPSQVEAVTDPIARRAFLKVMGASMALAGLTACTRQPAEKIVPYVRQPEEVVPGKPLFFATAMTLGGMATGVLVESHEGRPTKIEGNPEHPASLGATDACLQAAILDLYDPDRSRALTHLGEIRPWPDFISALGAALSAQLALQGRGLRIVTESVSSPTLVAQLEGVLARFPSARWLSWDPAAIQTARAGSKLAFGEYVDSHYRFDQADVIVSLDADFLGSGPACLKHARDFASRRRPELRDRMSRLYALESMPTPTGSRADHRFPMRPSQVALVARALAAALGVAGVEADAVSDDVNIGAIAADLQAHQGTSMIVPGQYQPAEVHALAHAMNVALGNVGRTVIHTEPVDPSTADQLQSMRELVSEMSAGQVDILLVLGGNPAFTLPPDLNFATAVTKVPLRVHLSSHVDETSELCHWQIPEAHFLETWGDARAFDGTASIVQPLILPLYGGRSALEVVIAMTETPEKPAYDVIREHWSAQGGRGAQGAGAQGARSEGATGATGEPDAVFEAAWRRWLHDGVIPDTAFAPKNVTLQSAIAVGASGGGATSDFEISFRNDPTILDGRFANNGWLQELPKPITKLTWDNAVIVSPATADALKAASRPTYVGGERGTIQSDVVELRLRGRSVRGAIFAVAGHPDNCATVHLGYGRRRGGRLAAGPGFDANLIRSSEAPWVDRGVEIVKTGERYPLACTQYHHLMEGRGIVRAVTREAFEHDPHHAVHDGFHSPPNTLTLIPQVPYDGYKWGMAIDINACIGCNACVVGCQAENNIPIVGKAEVLRGREMHWLRIDSYYRGDMRNPETYFQPVPCMQCENAPCEVVCPVNATVHSHEGLNDMVYNRCIGTRYCSNNCPYKVRRFNYFLYQDWETPSLKLGRNPDVTVRSRGVMEKCTYCVQRINAAKIDAEKERRPVRDGDIKTACEAVCPANAIVFGNLNDPNSRVSKLQAEARNYALLADLNTRPRTTYQAAVRNPNPELSR
jgi:molybdopterin-containing oxidoreductase family iron-sulfur binding subunit